MTTWFKRCWACGSVYDAAEWGQLRPAAGGLTQDVPAYRGDPRARQEHRLCRAPCRNPLVVTTEVYSPGHEAWVVAAEAP